MGEDKSTPCRGRTKEKEMALDRSHLTKASKLHTEMEPSREKKSWKAQNTWRRNLQAELEAQGYKWQDIVRLAQNRTRWESVVGGLCTSAVPKA